MTGPTSTDAASKAEANPYVGPRPFEPGEKLYGREDEITELSYRWNAERILLLYSPSGAGKSSLVQAGLLPRIRESFDVWGPTRVNLEVGPGGNRYVRSALQGFEERVPERLRRAPGELAGPSLAEYVEKRPRRRSAPRNVALVFDQFEEILTVDPLAVDAKREFFEQLGELLHNPRVWALFVLREDYLAPLDPYALQVPTHLKNRFRIDLLGLEAAREAVVNPARDGGREFPAAGQLIADLATTKVQRLDGSFREERGRHVEPVQLQVVCRRLWDAMPEDDLSIGPEDLEQFGDVTGALAGYYAESVARIAAGDVARERALRDWLGEALIQGDIRGQVLRGVEQSEGLPNELIDQLLKTHLVRAEKRAGATWYELSHDRLIEPVRQDNEAWRDEHLSEVQRRATLWESQDRPRGLLLANGELEEAERWAAGAAATELEWLFLEASREAQAAAERERRQARLIRRLAIAAGVVAVLAAGAGGVAFNLRGEALEQKEQAVEARREAEKNQKEAEAAQAHAEKAQSLAEKEKIRAEEEKARAEEEKQRAEEERKRAEEQKALAEEEKQRAEEQTARAEDEMKRAEEQKALAEEEKQRAEEEKQRAEEEKQRADDEAAKSARLRRVAEAEALAERTTRMTSPSNRELAALLAVQAHRFHRDAGEPEATWIYHALHRALVRLESPQVATLSFHQAAVRCLAVAADGRTLASGGEDGELLLVDLAEPRAEPRLLHRFPDGVRALSWSADGRWLAAGSFGGVVQVWDARQWDADPRRLAGVQDPGAGSAAVRALAFDPRSGGSRLAVALADGGPRIWDLDAGPEVTVLRTAAGAAEPGSSLRALTWLGDRRALAAAVDGEGIRIWDPASGDKSPFALARPQEAVRSLAWDARGRRLAAGTQNGLIRLWTVLGSDARPGPPLEGHAARVVALAFHPRRDLLISASFDTSLRLWDLGRPEAPPVVLEDHRQFVWTAVFSPDGGRFFSGGQEGEVRLWLTSSESLAEEICRIVGRDLTLQEWDENVKDDVEHERTCTSLPEAGT